MSNSGGDASNAVLLPKLRSLGRTDGRIDGRTLGFYGFTPDTKREYRCFTSKTLEPTTQRYLSGLWACFIEEGSMVTGTSIFIFQSKKLWKRSRGKLETHLKFGLKTKM
uniref:Uncharacterized protein n=1 Tax=Trichogramma kaykai TaxID=54128 RepID=A0ABD2W6L9_9HYME